MTTRREFLAANLIAAAGLAANQRECSQQSANSVRILRARKWPVQTATSGAIGPLTLLLK